MTRIEIAELSAGGSGSFRVRVSFGGQASYEVALVDPADQAGEGILAWYFEQHLRYPFLDGDRERQAVGQLAAYGEALFAQVLGAGPGHEQRSFP